MINIAGIEYKLAEKPYYGKFPFKVIVRGVQRQWRMSVRDQRAYNEFYASTRTMLDWSKKHSTGEWRVRRESDWSFFFVLQEDCEAFAHEFHKSLRFIAGPKNEYHRERMIESPKLLVRRSLFKGRFPYRVSINNNVFAGPLAQSLREWIDSQKDSDEIELNSGLSDWYNKTNHDRWSTKTVYFLEETTSLMLKLMLGDNLGKIEKVITVDEFSKQEATDQANA